MNDARRPPQGHALKPHQPSLAEIELIDAEVDDAPPPTPVQSRRGLLLLAGCLMLIAFNLRAAVTSLSPVLIEAIHDDRLSAAGASLLTTIPSLCFGLFAPTAPGLARRFGTERTLLGVLILLTLGAALRGLPATWALFAGHTLATAGIAIINVLLPGLVKRDFPRHAPLLTGLYTMFFCLGAAIAAGATVPLQAAFGGSWTAALAFWALPAGLAAALWAPLVPARPVAQAHKGFVVQGLWRNPRAWQVTFFMGLQSALAYIVFGWLAPILRERGLDPASAGLVLSVSVISQAAASLVAPSLATRGRDQRLAIALGVLVSLVGLMGCIYAPLATVWIWSVALGIGQGSLIAIALTLIVLRSTDSHVAAHLSGMAQGVGYILASGGPLLAGLLHSWTGSWNVVALFCLAIGACLLASGLGAGRAGHVRAVSVRRSMTPG
jgi:MFS transporter, CP family, cyanate transporter